MKKLNAISEFSEQRRAFLRQAFREAIARQSVIDANKAFKTAINIPAPRFWVSEVRAAVVVGKLLAGHDPLATMFPEKAEMFREIYRRFTLLRESRPDASIAELMVEIVNSPAPRSYISVSRAQNITRKPKKH